MRVAVLQFAADLDPAANRSSVEARLGDLETGSTELIVLPEAVQRDFGSPGDDLRPFAEPLDGPFVAMLAQQARRLGSTIVAGLFEQTEDPTALPYNTLVALGPDGGLLAAYRKIHLYDSFGYCESDRLRPGPLDPVTVTVDGVTCGLMTCYDLRFPELARSLTDAGAEALIAPAAWVAGEGKLHHWRTLLAARAIENTVAVIAAAQPAPRYTGHSLVLDASGTVLAEADGPSEAVLTAEVRAADTERIRTDNPSLRNRRWAPGPFGGDAR